MQVIIIKPTVAAGQRVNPSAEPVDVDESVGRMLITCGKARLAPEAAQEEPKPKRRRRSSSS